MAQDEYSLERDHGGNRYAGLGDEVAFVLASARDAAAEMREQAKQYAEALVESSRQEIAGMIAAAREEGTSITKAAEEQAERVLQSTRRQVAAIIEAAQGRAEEAERAAEDAIRRRDEMVQAEADLESGVTQVIGALQKELERLRLRRDALHTSTGPSPKDELRDLLASAAALVDDAKNHNS